MLLARLAGAGAGFLGQLVLARLMPTEDLGMFFAATSFAALGGLVLTQGYPGVMQRFHTRYRERGRQRLLSGFVSQIQSETVLLTLAVATAVAALGLLWPGLSSDNRLVILSVALCTAAASSLTLYGGFAAVERRFELAQFPETLIRPIVFLPLIFLLLQAGLGVTAGTVTALYAVLTAALAFIQYAGVSRDPYRGEDGSRAFRVAVASGSETFRACHHVRDVVFGPRHPAGISFLRSRGSGPVWSGAQDVVARWICGPGCASSRTTRSCRSP